jgi:ketosteroid isomerase-like protein
MAEIKALYERDIDEAAKVNVEPGWHAVSVNGPVAWVSAEATVKAEVGGKKMSLPIRKTVVLEKRGSINGWSCKAISRCQQPGRRRARRTPE